MRILAKGKKMAILIFIFLKQLSKIPLSLLCKLTKVAAGVAGVTGVPVTGSVQEKGRDFAPQKI